MLFYFLTSLVCIATSVNLSVFIRSTRQNYCSIINSTKVLLCFIFTLSPVGMRGIVISVSQCLFVCLFVCVAAHIYQNYTTKFHHIFYTYYRWLWLGPPLTAMQYVMYFRFCG